MKALVYLGPGSMQLQDVPDPVPAPGEVKVGVHVAAVCGSDLHGFREASSRRIPPLVMGHEAVGRIERVGPGGDERLVGRRVVLKPVIACGTCHACRAGAPNLCERGRLVGRDLSGAFAESLVVPAGNVVAVPEAAGDEAAVLAEPLSNAVHVVRRSVGVGDTVLVIGAGPLGLLTIRLARIAGAALIIAVDPATSRLAAAAADGADSTASATDGAQELVRQQTHGRGVDVVVDAAGFETTWELALRAVRAGGRVETIGLGQPGGRIDYHLVVTKEVRIAGSFACTDDDFDRAVTLIGRGEVTGEGWFTHMPLAEGQEAFERLVEPDTPLLKVILEP